ncbi:hypothetical protein [Saccharopolyspora spinosa]
MPRRAEHSDRPVQELMLAATDGEVVRIPVWRCLSDPAELLADLGC